MEPMWSLTSNVLLGAIIIGMILLLVLLLILVFLVVRNSVRPQQKEVQRLLAETAELLRENNRLLKEQSAESPSGERSRP